MNLPLLHHNILRLVRIASNDITTGLITNGSLLNIPFLKALRNLGLSKLNISVNNSTPIDMLKHLFDMYKIANKKFHIDCWFRSVIFSDKDIRG